MLRSIPITGVMPLPAVRNRILAGGLVAEDEFAGGLIELDDGARRVARRTRWLLTVPSGIAFTVMAKRPSSLVCEVSEYARHWRTPSTSTPMRTYWPGVWPRQPRPGWITTVAASRVSGCIATIRPRRSAPERSGSMTSR